MVLTFETINLNDTLFSELKELHTTLVTGENNSCSKEICARLEIEEIDVEPFLDYFSRMSNTEWINYNASKK